MVLPSPNNGDSRTKEPCLLHFRVNADDVGPPENHRLSDELDSTCSTPYVSAPSSPGRSPLGPSGYYFSAPASPMHFVLSRAPSSSYGSVILPTESINSSGSFEFEFSSRFSMNVSSGSGSMSSADELFLNGQIRPMKLSTHLQKPQVLSPLLDLDREDEVLSQRESEFERSEETVKRGREFRQRNGSLDRKARSLSPLRNAEFERHEENVARKEEAARQLKDSEFCKQNDTLSNETTPSCSASSSRSSSSGRNSKKWIFLKDLLHRSKSEGSGNNKEKFWSSILFSPMKEKKISSPSLIPSSTRDGREKTKTEPSQKQKQSKKATSKKPAAGKPANGVSKRRVPTSAHELHYTASRAQAEEMRKKTFLPYRQGLLGCLGFSSKGYGALNGLARTLNPVSSR